MVGEGLTRSSVRATSPISISWKITKKVAAEAGAP
jgi:hypothetical protein